MDHWWLGDDKLLPIRFPYWDPREHGYPAPITDIEGGDDKRRLCVSSEWVKHIVGMLDRLTRWDAWTGPDADRERAISNVERMMAQLGEQHDDCVDTVTIVETVIETVIETVEIYIGGGSAGENEMPCISIPDLIKIENGQLWGRNSCCEWELIGDLGVGGDVPAQDDGPVGGEVVEPNEWAPCGKIAGFVSALHSMIVAGESTYTSFGDFLPAVRDSVPGGVEMSRVSLYLLWLDYYAFRVAFSYETLTDADMIQKMLCKGVVGMLDNGDVTIPEFNFAINSVKSAIYETYGYDVATAVWTVWEQCYQVIGPYDCMFLMKLGAYNITADCTCPDIDLDAETEPDENGWYWSRAVSVEKTSTGGHTNLCVGHVMEHDVYGCRYQLYRTDDEKNYKRMSSVTGECDPVANAAWGDTSDHLEYQPDTHVWYVGNATLIDSLLAAEGVASYSGGTSNYNTPSDPAYPSYDQGEMVTHGFQGASLDSGDWYKITMRWLMNTNSPSHGGA